MSKITRNIIYQLAYQILVIIMPLITAPYISRVIGAQGVGTYSYVSSMAYYFLILITLGLTNYGNRAIAKCRGDRDLLGKTFWSIYLMQLMCGVAVLAAYFVYCFAFAEKDCLLYFVIYSMYLIGAAIDINWFFFGLQRFRVTTLRSASVRILVIISVFVFVRGENALTGYFVIMSGSAIVSSTVMWTQLRRNISFYRPSFREVIVHLKPNLILFIPILAMSVYRVMDKIMIKHMVGIVENGYYENADRVIAILLTAFSAVATVMMPAVSRMVADGKEEKVNRMVRDMMQLIMCFSVAMTFGLAVVATEFAPLFFGEEFKAAGYLLVGLAPTILLTGWKNVLRSQYLIPYEKDKAYVISLAAGAVVNVIINLLLIPQYKAMGAVLGTIAAEATGFIIQTAAVSKGIKVSRLLLDAVIFVPSGAVMALIVKLLLLLLPYHIFSVAAAALVGAACYFFLAAISLRQYDKDRFDDMKQIILSVIKRDKVK